MISLEFSVGKKAEFFKEPLALHDFTEREQQCEKIDRKHAVTDFWETLKNYEITWGAG